MKLLRLKTQERTNVMEDKEDVMYNKDKIIQFPTNKTPLNEEEYERFEYHKKKMEEAKSKAEMDYHYNEALIIIEKSKNTGR
jgi:hypothetical protein